ncbi:MAG TPA: hypothetical protein VGA49_03055 [Patescibacteria group bacterium]
MFGRNKKEKSIESSADQPAGPAPGNIRTIPDQFLYKEEKKKTGGLVIIIIGALVLIVLVAGGVWLLTGSFGQPTEVTRVENVNLEVKPPVNENLNVNLNVNANLNSNVNANLNANANVNAGLPPVIPGLLASSLDSDQDGLTDVEEELYGTNPNLPDSDGDGHIDALELMNLFNPAEPAPAELPGSNLVELYSNPSFDYRILYPSRWIARPIDTELKEVIFSSETGEFIEVLVSENPEGLSVLNWYLQQSPTVTPSQVQSVVTKNNIRGIQSVDGLTVYLVKPVDSSITGEAEAKQYIYAISYNPGTRPELNFKSTLKMMYNSFELGQLGQPAPSSP